MSIKVLLADDHVMVREGLGSVLERDPDIEVVGEAGDADVALPSKRLDPIQSFSYRY